MIDIVNKKECCGCSACVAICPKSCIQMLQDDEGFEYPNVNVEKCIYCQKCVRICPVYNKKNKSYVLVEDCISKEKYIRNVISSEESLPDSYVLYNKDRLVRYNSTSGGFFSLIGKYVLSQNGIVYGVAVDENKMIRHIRVENEKDLCKLRGSKYVQSKQINIFSRIEKDLKNKKIVLYTGTPCQVAGLHSFLKESYTNLITVDIFCHGVGSPAYWDKYVKYMENKYKSSIECIKFREKTYGYNSACMAVYFKNGKSSHKGHDDDLFWTAFSKCYIFRPSCYDCKFKTINHKSDYSIGDFWDVSELEPKFKEANGCSLVLCHTQLGKEILSKISNQLEMVHIDLEKALLVNGGHQITMLIKSSLRPEKRDSFLIDMNHQDIDKLVKKYMPLSLKQKIKCLLKPIFYKIGILERMKNYKRT